MGFKIKPKNSDKSEVKSFFKIAGEIRKSQSITTYGPGSLIDFPRMSGILCGIDNWESTLGKKNFNKLKIHERNLEKILGKKYFVQPQTSDAKSNNGFNSGITAVRFPEYCYCPECGALDKYYKIEKKTNNTKEYNRDSFCAMCYQRNNRDVKLIPSRFVVSCKYGHMDEFPYDAWVHRNTGRCANPKLSIEVSKKTNSLEGITIKCQCGAKENLEGIMDKNALYRFNCYGSMPWLGKKEDNRGWYTELEQGETCEGSLRVLQRGANNVYYPDIVSALTIPPYSSRVQRILEDDMELLEEYNEMPEDLRKGNLDHYFNKNKERLRCTFEQYYNSLELEFGFDNNNHISLDDLLVGEYNALCDEDCSDPDFLTIETDVPEEFRDLIDQVKVVGRLREVEVLKGFRRIATDEGELAPLSKKAMDWLPGNELFGEGLFIRLNEYKVSEWEKKNTDRYASLISRAKNNFFASTKISESSTRYILLHTLSHLVIRELTMKCGYSTASLKEKIYSSISPDKSMCGILIYTASADSDGSLGGLARQGVTEKMRDTLLDMLENASWCSNDPICIDSKSQGYASLNYAGCHACALLPETSCEINNILLDRAALVGTSDNASLGYFYTLFL